MKERIYNYLNHRKESLTVAQITTALRADNETVRRNVAQLVRQGSLVQDEGREKRWVRYKIAGPLDVKVSTKGLPQIKIPARKGEAVYTGRGLQTAHLATFLSAPHVIRRVFL